MSDTEKRGDRRRHKGIDPAEQEAAWRTLWQWLLFGKGAEYYTRQPEQPKPESEQPPADEEST